jgi:trimeric autotransporter adhesin
MGTFYAQYPAAGSGSSNASVSANGAPIPGSSTLVAGENPSGNQQPLQTDASGNLYVSLASEPVTPFNTRDAADGTPGSANPGTAIQVAGTDGTDLRPLSTDSSGNLNINNVSGTVSLPTGASTAANQATIISDLGSILANQTNGTQVTNITGTVPLPTGAATSADQTNVQSAPGTPQTTAITVQGNASGIAIPVSATLASPTTVRIEDSTGAALDSNGSGALLVDGSAVTQPVSGTVTVQQSTAANLNATVTGTVAATQSGTWNINNISGTVSLPTGASTAANQATVIANQTNGTQTTQINGGGNTASVTAGNALQVDGSATTQPISAASLPLPTGASTAANQTSVQSSPGTPQTTAVTVQGNASGVPLPISGTITATNSANGNTGAAVPAQATQVGGSDGTDLRALSVNASGQLNINNISGTVSLPTGASTAVNQATVIANQTNGTQTTQINGNGNTAFVSASNALLVDGSATTQPVSGTVTANAGTGNFTVVQSTASNLNATVVGTTAAGSGAATGLVTIQGNASGTPVPISGSITATNPSVSATGAAVPADATMIGGSDGTDLQAISVDTTGKVNINNISGTVSLPTGASTAANQTSVQSAPGTPQTTAITIQGNASGVAVPISGTVTATNPSVSATGAAVPADATMIGGTDGTDLRAVSTDATGKLNINNISGTVSLPTGAATSANQTNGTQTTQINGGGNTATVTASNALKVDGSAVTQPVSGTVTANAGTGNFTVVQSTASSLNATVVGTTAAGSGASTGLITIQGNASGTAVPISGTVTATNPSVSATGAAVPADATMIGGTDGTNLQALSVNSSGQLNVNNISGTVSLPTGAATSSNQTTLGSQTTKINDGTNTAAVKAASTAPVATDPALVVAISPNTGAVTTFPATSSTATLTNVASSASSVQIVASNAGRKGFYVFNDSTQVLYLKFGTTASTSSYTVQVPGGGYYEMPNPTLYTGELDGIWASANGNARVTELS